MDCGFLARAVAESGRSSRFANGSRSDGMGFLESKRLRSYPEMGRFSKVGNLHPEFKQEVFMHEIAVHPKIDSPCTEIYIGEHLLAGKLFEKFCGKLRVALVVDASVEKLYGEALAKRLGADLFAIPSGEGSKTRAMKQVLEDRMFEKGFGRDSVLIAMGGGVTTDLGGFVAATYLRGISLILIPTSLLAMVDASVGGKTAVDTPCGKNLIGAFYHPKANVMDTCVLKTLPEKEWTNGIAEILKMGLVYEEALWKGASKARSHPEDIVYRAVKAKVEVIEKDPQECGLRRILNFGHTIGHGLEALADYEMAHGEAVALGCLAESFLSFRLGYLSEKKFDEIERMFRRFPFCLKLPLKYSRERLFEKMMFDKKASGGEIRFVLIDRIGGAIPFDGTWCRPVPKSELEKTAAWMEAHYG